MKAQELKEIERLKEKNKLFKEHLQWLIYTFGCPTTMKINKALEEDDK